MVIQHAERHAAGEPGDTIDRVEDAIGGRSAILRRPFRNQCYQ